MLRFEMFLTSAPPTRASREAAQVWRATAQLVSVGWQTFLAARAEARRLAFASYLAALDAEEAAAADVAALAARDRDVVHLRLTRTTASSSIMSTARSERGSRTDLRLGGPAQEPCSSRRANARPTQPQFNPDNPGPPAPDVGPPHE
jgi:hypothetical protein